MLDKSPPSIDNHIYLIRVIFLDHNEAETIKGLCGKDAQAFFYVMDETLCHTFASEEPPHWLKLPPEYWKDIGCPSPIALEEVFDRSEDMWLLGFTPKICANSTVLQSNGSTTCLWWICQGVGGQINLTNHHIPLKLKDVTWGLILIHREGIVHGDLRGMCLWIPRLVCPLICLF